MKNLALLLIVFLSSCNQVVVWQIQDIVGLSLLALLLISFIIWGVIKWMNYKWEQFRQFIRNGKAA